MNFANKWSVWVPYGLHPQNGQRRVEVAKTLLEMENRGSFFDVLVTLHGFVSVKGSKWKMWVTQGQNIK